MITSQEQEVEDHTGTTPWEVETLHGSSVRSSDERSPPTAPEKHVSHEMKMIMSLMMEMKMDMNKVATRVSALESTPERTASSREPTRPRPRTGDTLSQYTEGNRSRTSIREKHRIRKTPESRGVTPRVRNLEASNTANTGRGRSRRAPRAQSRGNSYSTSGEELDGYESHIAKRIGDDILHRLTRKTTSSAYNETTNHKLITQLIEHKQLKNRRKPVKWLINLKVIAADRGWSDKRFRAFLPRLWNVNSSVAVSNWFRSRANIRSTIDLERAFLRKYAPGGLTRLAVDIQSSIQQEGQSCEDFLQQLENDRIMLLGWDESMVSNDVHFIRTLEARFIDQNMIEIMHEMFGELEEGERDEISLRDIRSACRKADRPKMFDTLKDRTPVFNVTPAVHQSDYEATVRRIIHEQSCTSNDDHIERAFDEFSAMSELYDLAGTASTIDINRVLVARAGVRPQPEREQKDYPAPGYNVVNGPQSAKHICHGEHRCPFYTLLRRCTLPQGKCSHFPHKERSSTICKLAAAGDCQHGAFCAFRHPGDKYKIWFYDWKKRVYKLYIWKDYFSSFSSLKK